MGWQNMDATGSYLTLDKNFNLFCAPFRPAVDELVCGQLVSVFQVSNFTHHNYSQGWWNILENAIKPKTPTHLNTDIWAEYQTLRMEN